MLNIMANELIMVQFEINKPLQVMPMIQELRIQTVQTITSDQSSNLPRQPSSSPSARHEFTRSAAPIYLKLFPNINIKQATVSLLTQALNQVIMSTMLSPTTDFTTKPSSALLLNNTSY